MIESNVSTTVCSKSFCLVKDVVLLNDTIHLVSDKYSMQLLKYQTDIGKGFIEFHSTDSLEDIGTYHGNTFFLGHLEDQMSILVSVAVLWDEWYSRVGKLDFNRMSISGPSELYAFARVILDPIVDFDVDVPVNIKINQSVIIKRKLSVDYHGFFNILRKFKRFYDSRKMITNSQQDLCMFTRNPVYMMQFKRYLHNIVQITPKMDFKKQAHLFSKCDILIISDSIDLGTAFLLKQSVKIVGINANEEMVNELKNFWNLKVFLLDININDKKSLESLFNFISIITTADQNQYFMFMPWEQLNNQLIGFKAACAMAKKLQRILVLPYLGYRIRNEWDFSFSFKDYSWFPMEKYFKFENLPCRTISFYNFKALYGNQIGSIHFNPVAKATSHQQLIEYYRNILGLGFTGIKDNKRMSQLSDQTILSLFENDQSNVLSFGSLFWAYGFNKTQEYPLKNYISYMDNELYKQITKGIIIKENLEIFSKESIRKSIGSKSLISVHIRRGDYWDKCKSISDPVLQSHCYPSMEIIKQRIQAAIKSENIIHQNGMYKSEWDSNEYYVYISTNLDGNRSELKKLSKDFNILFFEDVHDLKEIGRLNFDPIHTALLDKEIGIHSNLFIGNFYSSFSRTIFEGRELLNRTFMTF